MEYLVSERWLAFLISLYSLVFAMGWCECPSGPKEPRKKRARPYEKVNAYSQPFSCEQIITFLIVIAQIALHAIFVIPALPAIQSTVLWVMLGYCCAVLVLVGYDYMIVTLSDPVDPLVEQEELAGGWAMGELKLCLLCDCQVQLSSHHCMRCNRCVVEFDHHCRFLNNCIGNRNYEPFFRLLLTYSSFCACTFAMAVWTASKAFKDQGISFRWARWGMVADAVISLLALVAVGILMGFHCYISCCEGTTTFGHNHAPRSTPDSQRYNIRQSAPPPSAQRLSLENRFS